MVGSARLDRDHMVQLQAPGPAALGAVVAVRFQDAAPQPLVLAQAVLRAPSAGLYGPRHQAIQTRPVPVDFGRPEPSPRAITAA